MLRLGLAFWPAIRPDRSLSLSFFGRCALLLLCIRDIHIPNRLTRWSAVHRLLGVRSINYCLTQEIEMTRYSEPTNRQIEEACAMLFLAETKRLLHSEHLSGLTLELEVESNIHNQRVYRVHATRKGLRITDPEGRYVPPPSQAHLPPRPAVSPSTRRRPQGSSPRPQQTQHPARSPQPNLDTFHRSSPQCCLKAPPRAPFHAYELPLMPPPTTHQPHGHPQRPRQPTRIRRLASRPQSSQLAPDRKVTTRRTTPWNPRLSPSSHRQQLRPPSPGTGCTAPSSRPFATSSQEHRCTSPRTYSPTSCLLHSKGSPERPYLPSPKGQHHDSGNYTNPAPRQSTDPIAEQGMRGAVRLCMAKQA